MSGCILAVRISASRLQAILGHGVKDTFLDRPGSPSAPILVNNGAAVRRIASELLSTAHQGVALSLFAQGKIVELLLEAVLAVTPMAEDENNARKVRDILVANPKSPPSLAALAKMVGVTERKLNAQFRAVYQSAIFEWLNEWRMQQARDLVIAGRVSIKEIAFSLGYSHVSTFTAVFTRRFGAPPTLLRAGAVELSSPRRPSEF